METIIVKTNDKSRFLFLKTFLENLRWDLDIEYINTELGDNGTSMPALMSVEELRLEVLEATQELKEGKGLKHQEVINELEAWI